MRSLILTMIGCGGLLVSAALTPAGCGDVDAAFDCHAACNRYAECFDKSYNVSACQDRCRTAAKNDPDIKSKADQCEACIDDRSCASATFSCATTCGPILAL
jgi:hypothetical protein